MSAGTTLQDDELPSNAPSYMAHRLAVWNAALAAREALRPQEKSCHAAAEIRIELPDGSVRMGVAGETSPMVVAEGISQTLARKALVAVVNGKQWDMERPLMEDCTLKICDFDTLEGKSVLWHSTAHMLGEAMECKYHGELCIGPPIEDGFYYDMHMSDDCKVTEKELEELSASVDKIAKSKRTFQRLELTKDEARDMFSYNRFKLEIIEELEHGATITAYRDGPFIDLCRGPHVPQSTRMKAVMCKGTGQAYWRAKSENPSLQRVYGISFPDKKLLKEYKTMLQEAAKRDHRVLGPKQDLLMFHPYSPGCPFLLPNGQRIFNTLTQFIRNEYWKRGFSEVQTPNLFDIQLWETSGHAANYRDNMFLLEVEGRDFGLKPMNCPSHCLIFASRVRSHRELPMRLADFGVLHRNELSGSLGGLTRLRRFQQDDAHIFCLAEQVEDEVLDCLKFLEHTYRIFGFEYELELSTRPEKFLGEVSQWDVAEKMLADALVKFTGKQCGEAGGWQLNPADGAFYGPKIDIKVYDALKRRHQCATLQLDFQLPARFNLQVQSKSSVGASDHEAMSSAEPDDTADSDRQGDACGNEKDDSTSRKLKRGFERPVIIHRAIYGSFERFFAILIEHFGGYWPFWLSPRQAIVVPISEKCMEYARNVQTTLHDAKFYVDLDTSDRTIGKKILEARNCYYNAILVVGEQEAANNTVSMRVRGSEESKALSIDDVRHLFEGWRDSYK